VKVGLNTTLIVQVAPTATDVPHVWVCENCFGFVPESVMRVMDSATLAVFITVISLAALRSLTNCSVVPRKFYCRNAGSCDFEEGSERGFCCKR
jgi:hypothetical protein